MLQLHLAVTAIAVIGLSGCLSVGPTGPVAPPEPPPTSHDLPASPLGDLDPNMEYNQDVGGGTPQLDRPLSSYEKLSMFPAQKKKYDDLNKKKRQI